MAAKGGGCWGRWEEAIVEVSVEGAYLVSGFYIGLVIAGFGRNVNVVEFRELKRFRHCFVFLCFFLHTALDICICMNCKLSSPALLPIALCLKLTFVNNLHFDSNLCANSDEFSW